MFDLLVGLMGVGVGYILAKINPEEVKDTLQYVPLILRSIFLIFTLLLVMDLYKQETSLIMIVFAIILSSLSFILLYKKKTIMKKTIIYQLVPYVIFIMSYFLVHREMQLLFSSIIFLYGIPIGIQCRKEKI